MSLDCHFDDDETAVLRRVVDEAIETEESFQAWEESEHDCLDAPVVQVGDKVIMTKLRADSIAYEEHLKRIKTKLEGGE